MRIDDAMINLVINEALDDVRTLSGQLSTGSVTLRMTGALGVGIWANRITDSKDTKQDEVFVALGERL